MAGNHSNFPVLLTMGFAGGLGFAWLFLHSTPPAPAAATEQPRPVAAAAGTVLKSIPNLPRDASSLGEVEEQFRYWGGYAVWSHNVTQFALWNRETDQHSDFYEVRRVSRIYYFRTLPQKDWPLVDHGEMVRCALWFAEPPEMREKYYREFPNVVPGRPIMRSWPERPPLLPPLPPAPTETEALPALPALTPGAGS